jgi:hypothetical protein
MSFFTLSGNKLAATVIAAGALVVTGTGVAVSLPGDPAAQVSETESQQPTVAATDSPEPTPTVTETDSPEPTPTETETEEPEPAPTETETETEEPEPAPTETEDSELPDSTPAGPDATGAAAFGLCNAYSQGGLKNPKSTAYQALVKAAGSESSVAAYCETVVAPQDRPDDVPAEPSTGTSGSSGEQQVQQQQVQQVPAPQQPAPQQRQGSAWAGNGPAHANQHGAPAAKGNPGHPSNNSHKQSDRGQR